MPEIKLKKRYKAAGDVFNALLAVGFDPETASAFLNGINDADVAPVVHGEWIYVHTYARGRCSICNSFMQYDNQSYCANCGAKMDGERMEQE